MRPKPYRPPFTITSAILDQFAAILMLVGKYEGLSLPPPQPKLRKKNRIQTVQSTLAIEGNSLSEEQVTAILEEKRVVGPKRDILEVENALRVYAESAAFVAADERHLLRAHKKLMQGLLPDAGRYRTGGVGIIEGSKIRHVAPPAKQVPRLIAELLSFLKADHETHLLLKASIFHYEFEFIHPFADGNGRMGRLWQHVLLRTFHPIFDHLPFESLIRKNQAAYYAALREADRAGDSTPFIEFSLRMIALSLSEFFEQLRPAPLTNEARLERARAHFRKSEFARKEYTALFKSISDPTASRDLAHGVAQGQLVRIGEKARARYRFR